MILVTVGTHSAPFDRLIRRMDRIAELTDEEVLMQVGTARFRPSHAPYFRFLSEEDYERAFRKSRVVVSHAGVGTILRCTLSEKPLVCSPRLRRYAEHWDNHQLDLCRALSQAGRLQYFSNPDGLNLKALDEAVPPRPPQSGSRLAEEVLSFLNLGNRLTPGNSQGKVH